MSLQPQGELESKHRQAALRKPGALTCEVCEIGYLRFAILPVLPARFFAKIQHRTDGCWLWTGSVNRHYRYPRFAYPTTYHHRQERAVYAHRYAYEVVRGPIPEHLEVDHLCRNSLCVNPWHLELVTHAENIRRRGPTRWRGDGKTWNGGSWPLLRKRGLA